jgi:hypothetical protein
MPHNKTVWCLCWLELLPFISQVQKAPNCELYKHELFFWEWNVWILQWKEIIQISRTRKLKYLVSFLKYFGNSLTGMKLMELFMETMNKKQLSQEEIAKLKDTHSTSAGLKAFCTWFVHYGIDECRQVLKLFSLFHSLKSLSIFCLHTLSIWFYYFRWF